MRAIIDATPSWWPRASETRRRAAVKACLSEITDGLVYVSDKQLLVEFESSKETEVFRKRTHCEIAIEYACHDMDLREVVCEVEAA